MATTTAESQRMKALAGLLTNEDLYDDDLFFSGSVKQKQQVIVEKLSKNAPIKDRGVTAAATATVVQHHSSLHSKQMSDNKVVVSQKQQQQHEDDQDVQFGQSADQSIFVSASVRERAAAMSGFLTKKKEGPTSGQARAMEWRGGGNSSSAVVSSANNNTAMECAAPNKIAPTFVSQFDRVGENDANGGTPTNRLKMKKKSKPSFLFQWDDSPRAKDVGGKEEEGTPTRAPLTPRTSLTPRTPSRGVAVAVAAAANNDNSGNNSDNNNLLSPRTPRQSTTPRGRHRSNMLSSPRASSTGMNHSQANFEEEEEEEEEEAVTAAAATAAVNSSMAVEAGSISAEIDDWLGGMSLSDSEEGDHPNDNNGDDEFFMNDLDKVLSEANGFLENVVESESEEEKEVEGVHFGFNEGDEDVGMSDELDTELESARQLAEGFTRFLVCEQESMSPVVVGGRSSRDAVEDEVESARQLAEGFSRFLVNDEEEDEVVDEQEEEEEVHCAWAGGEEEEEVEEEEYVLSESIEDEVSEDELGEEESVEENDGDWEGWTRNNDFFADFDGEDEAPETTKPVLSQEEITPTPMESDMLRSETQPGKPKLKIQIKGAPEFKPAKKEADEGVFFYASQLSPLAGDDEQLLDNQSAVPSPVSVEPVSSKADSSTKKFDASPKKFGFKKIVRRARQESNDASVEEPSVDTSPTKFDTTPKKFGLKKIVHRGCPESDDESVEEPLIGEEEEGIQFSPFQAHFGTSASSTKSDETEKKSVKTPPKLNIYIKGAPQFTQPQQNDEEDAFYFSQPSPLVGDDKGLLSSNFSSSPSVFEQKKEKTLTSSTKKHFKNFVNKTLPAKGSIKYDQEVSNDVFSDQSGPECFNNNFFSAAPASPERPSGPECFNNDFFFAAPASPVRQTKDAMKEGGSTKKKILGLLSGKKKRQNRGMCLLDD